MSQHQPTDDRVPRSSRRLLAPLLGLFVGAAVVMAMPRAWLFVTPTMNHDGMATHADASTYACPMFCVVMDHLPHDSKCPVCGMTMTVVSSESTLNRDERRMIGLETASIERLPLVHSLRAVGEVDYDETRLARITARVGGWLETVWVDSTWVEVVAGEPLAAIYSPELYAAEQEYLVAWKAGQKAPNGSQAGGIIRPAELLQAARRRLELLDVDEREIADLQDTGQPRDSVVFRAPIGGVVVERRALEGASIEKGATIYTVADLSRVWVQALVFEADLSWVEVGQQARLQVDGQPQPIEGIVSFIDPAIDRDSRTARVRIEVANPIDERGVRPLRIGQRVDAWLQARLDAKGMIVPPDAPSTQQPPIEPLAITNPLAVPRSAVLRTGQRDLIYVLFTERETNGGKERDYHLDPEQLPDKLWYEPVQVELGPLAQLEADAALARYYPVLGVIPPRPRRDATTGKEVELLSLRRLTPGVTVVTQGNLLLDSQAQLAGKPSLLFPEGNRGTNSDPHAGH